MKCMQVTDKIDQLVSQDSWESFDLPDTVTLRPIPDVARFSSPPVAVVTARNLSRLLHVHRVKKENEHFVASDSAGDCSHIHGIWLVFLLALWSNSFRLA